MQPRSKSDLTTYSPKRKTIELPIITPEAKKVRVGKLEYREDELAHKNRAFIMGVFYLIEMDGAEYDEIRMWSFREACSRYNVTCQELIDAYWRAYSDPYVGKAGIQFRNLWKHIENSRTGGQRPMSYDAMLDDMHRKSLPMSAYRQVDELDENGNRKWVLK